MGAMFLIRFDHRDVCLRVPAVETTSLAEFGFSPTGLNQNISPVKLCQTTFKFTRIEIITTAIVLVVGALSIGLILGLLGSGGSVLTVPVLVYLVGHDAKISIAESMAIVSLIGFASVIPYARAGQIDWKSVIYFGIPGMIGTFIGAWLGGYSSDSFQLAVFGVVLLLAAAFMIRKAFFARSSGNQEDSLAPDPKRKFTTSQTISIVFEGLAVGVLTGFVGVGGGFLIVPALVVFGKLPMRLAIGTSLVIVVLKSVIGFAKYQHYLVEHAMSVDWTTIGTFSLLGTVGGFVGQRLNSRLSQRVLQQAFAVFLVLIGGFILLREGSAAFAPDDKQSIQRSYRQESQGKRALGLADE